MKTTRKLSRRSFFLTVAGTVAVASTVGLIAPEEAKAQSGCSDSDSGRYGDPGGSGRRWAVTAAAPAARDRDSGRYSDPAGNGRCRRVRRSGCTDSDTGRYAIRPATAAAAAAVAPAATSTRAATAIRAAGDAAASLSRSGTANSGSPASAGEPVRISGPCSREGPGPASEPYRQRCGDPVVSWRCSGRRGGPAGPATGSARAHSDRRGRARHRRGRPRSGG